MSRLLFCLSSTCFCSDNKSTTVLVALMLRWGLFLGCIDNGLVPSCIISSLFTMIYAALVCFLHSRSKHIKHSMWIKQDLFEHRKFLVIPMTLEKYSKIVKYINKFLQTKYSTDRWSDPRHLQWSTFCSDLSKCRAFQAFWAEIGLDTLLDHLIWILVALKTFCCQNIQNTFEPYNKINRIHKGNKIWKKVGIGQSSENWCYSLSNFISNFLGG